MFNFPWHIKTSFFQANHSACECACTCYKDNYHVNKQFEILLVLELLLNNVFYPDVSLLH